MLHSKSIGAPTASVGSPYEPFGLLAGSLPAKTDRFSVVALSRILWALIPFEINRNLRTRG
jgi:hypothetical protein